MAKLAQRACRECCGYHSGYAFKRQPIGAKYLNAAAETLNYVNAKMQQKSGNQKYHYMSHRILQDFQHRCIARPAPEEWNLATNWHPHDVTNAEFFRTYRSMDFPGGYCCVVWRQSKRSATDPTSRKYCLRSIMRKSLISCTYDVSMISTGFAAGL